VAYKADGDEVRTVAVAGGAPRLLCRGCQEVGDWTRDGGQVAVVTRTGVRTALGLADVQSGEVATLATSEDGRSLNRPSLAPDNRWIAFRAMDDRSQAVYVARFGQRGPIPPDAWMPIGPPERDLRPVGWSPSGRMLYLFSSRDGFRCLYVQRVDPSTGRPAGEPTLVKHLHNMRGVGGGGASVISTGAGNAVGRKQILFDYPDLAVNVWQMRLGVLTPPGPTPPTTTP
jgi:Tol biopolymer transport system component